MLNIMNRIEINVVTGERKEIPLTPEEIAVAQAQYQEWLAVQPTKEQQIAALEAQLNELKGVTNGI